MNCYMVFEVRDRSVCSCKPCFSLDSAVKYANKCLLNYVKSWLTPIALGSDIGLGKDWAFATEKNLCGWCNYGGIPYDVYVVEAPDVAVKSTRTWRAVGYHGFSDYDGPGDNNFDFTIELDPSVTKSAVIEIVRQRYIKDRVVVFNVEDVTDD